MTSTAASGTNTRIQNSTARSAAQLFFFVVLILALIGILFRAGILYIEITTNLDAPRAAAFEPLGIPLVAVAIYRIALQLVYAITWIGVGLLIFWKRRDERIGLASAFFFVLTPCAITGLLGDNLLYWQPQWGFAAVFIQWLNTVSWIVYFSYWVIFPTGTIQPRWMLLLILVWVVFQGSFLLPLDSPLYWLNLPRWLQSLPVMLALLGLLIGQVYRYRRLYTPAQRAQTRWILFSVLVVGAIGQILFQFNVPLYAVTTPQQALQHELLAPWSEVILIAIPLSFIFALLRYRLWDVDIAINRSIVYSIVGGILITLMFLVVTVAQLIFAENVNILFAVVLSVALSALAWRPLQQRVQHFVDVRLYRLRFDQNEISEAQKPKPITNPGALSGRKLGVYEVTDLLGRGGMGEVYKGVGEGRTVAIKVLSTAIEANDELIKRFEREAETGMALNHPNIAHVYAFGNADGLAYMVQEYLQGEDLHDYLKHSGKADIETTLEILGDVAKALDAAHEQGFIHRDIKPSNIMLCLGAEGKISHAVLMDFGITKIRNAKESLTGTGVIGTIDYMAPEQIQSRKTIDGRADIYALGIVAYEMVTGRRPFEGGVAQILFAHLSQPAPSPREFNAELPRAVSDALLKALSKEPEERFTTASDFVSALGAA